MLQEKSFLQGVWYVVFVLRNTAKVMERLRNVLENSNLAMGLVRMLLPIRKVLVKFDGKEYIKDEFLFPGYFFVQIKEDADDLRNFISKFYGVVDILPVNCTKVSLSFSQVFWVLQLMKQDIAKTQMFDDLEIGDEIEILLGSLLGFNGKVIEKIDNSKLVVEVYFFKRSVRMKIDKINIKKIKKGGLK